MLTKKTEADQSSNFTAVDVGSTVIKVARIRDGVVLDQIFHNRLSDKEIYSQVKGILGASAEEALSDEILCCSSANGGLRVGIVCLTNSFSGEVFRNQTLLAGGNPVFEQTLGEQEPVGTYVDILLVGGGIDCEDAGPLHERLSHFRPDLYNFGSLIFAGNSYLGDYFHHLFPASHIIDNPLTSELTGRNLCVLESLRRAYLDDLVKREFTGKLQNELHHAIRPTPEVVSAGFSRILNNQSSIKVAGPIILLDIGGATTDVHYATELVRPDSNNSPLAGSSVARYVFTDLGVVASGECTRTLLRQEHRLYQFIESLGLSNIRTRYQDLREGETEISQDLLSYACYFMALDRMHNKGNGSVPTIDLRKVSTLILTGGASQGLDKDALSALFRVVSESETSAPLIMIDYEYQIWIDGILSQTDSLTSDAAECKQDPCRN